MADLKNLPLELARLVKSVMGEVVQLAATPWQLEAYCASCGAPTIPSSLLGRIDALTSRKNSESVEAALEILRDAQEICDGIAESIRAAHLASGATTNAQAAKLAFESVYRMFYPIILVCTRRDPSIRYYYPFFAIPMVLDDRLAEHFAPGLSIERLVGACASLWNQMRGGTEDNLLLTGFYSLAASVFLVPKVVQGIWDKPPKPGEPTTEHVFAFGWESDLAELPPEDPLNLPDDALNRPAPVWLAQRTFSVRWEPVSKPFLLSRYQSVPEFAPAADEAAILTATMTPLPTAVGGPAAFLEVGGAATLGEVELGDWRVRVRGHAETGGVIPVGGGRLSGGGGAGIALEAGWAPNTARGEEVDATDEGGDGGGVSLDVGGVSLVAFGGAGVAASRYTASAALDDLGITIRVSKARLSLAPKSAVVKALLKGGFTASLDVGATLSMRQGLVIDGSSGLELYLAMRQRLGNKWAGAEVSYLRFRLAAERRETGTEIAAEGTLGVSFSLAGATLTLEGLGARTVLATGTPGGKLLGIADVDIDLVRPAGLALKIDWGPVQGGGYFSHDATADRFAGAIEVALGKTWALRGVGFCEPRPGGGTSTLVSAALERNATSPGLEITGIGFLLALHRRGDGDAMRDALVSGALDALLFPSDPLGQSTVLVAALSRMFPPTDDVHVIGVMVKFAFAKGLFVGKLGLLVQFGTGRENRTKLFLAMSAVLAPPAPLDRVLRIQVLGIGEYDAATGELYIRARLHNSRLCGGDLQGEAVIFHGDVIPGDADPSKGTFFSIGGYHPKYFGGKGPGKARVDQRLALTIARRESVKLEAQFYLAFTPSAFHLGARARLEVKASGFGVEGQCGFDGFVTYDWDFQIDVFGSVKLILFSRTVTELRLEGQFRGQDPWCINGTVKFKLAWWTVSKSFDKTLSDERGSAASNDNVLARLRQGLSDPGSYDSAAPGGVVLTSVQRTGIWAAPERGLRMVQKVAPLDTPIERFGRTPLRQPQSFRIERVEIGGASRSTRATTAEFSPGLYYSLRGDAALVAPAAERLPAGFDAGHDAIAVGDEVGAASLYDEVIVDRQYRPRTPAPTRAAIPAALFEATVRPPPRTTEGVVVRPPRYRTGDGTPTSFSAAWTTRHGRVRRVEGA